MALTTSQKYAAALAVWCPLCGAPPRIDCTEPPPVPLGVHRARSASALDENGHPWGQAS